MATLHLIFLTYVVLMTSVKLNTAEKLTIVPEKFEIRKNVDSCDKVEFFYENVSEDLWCMMKCAKNDTCKGVFSDTSTGHCTGCSKAGPSSNTENIIKGTYFELRSKPVVKSCEGPGLMIFQGFCYFFTQGLGFQGALSECRRQGADIAVIENEDENNFLIQRAKLDGDNFYITGIVSDPQIQHGMWVQYTTSAPAMYLPWHDGEPNNSDSTPRCATLHSFTNYEWADEACQSMTGSVRMICKM